MCRYSIDWACSDSSPVCNAIAGLSQVTDTLYTGSEVMADGVANAGLLDQRSALEVSRHKYCGMDVRD